MIRDRFQRKLALFFTGLVAVVVVATNRNVAERVEAELAVGARVVARTLDQRSRQLLQSVRVLTDDFGFKQAVATGDHPTIRSALGNHATRIDADMAAVLDRDGGVRAGTLDSVDRGDGFPLGDLLARAVEDGEAVGFGVIDGRAYQLVIVPVRAPVPVAWACLGFAVDNALAGELARLTQAEVSFQRPHRQGTQVLATSLADADAAIAPGASTGDPSESAAAVRTADTSGEQHLVTTRTLSDDWTKRGL